MFTSFLIAGSATVLLVIVLSFFVARRLVDHRLFELILAGFGLAWLAVGLFKPTIQQGGVTIEVFWLGSAMLLYAAVHWLYWRFTARV